MSTYRSAKRIPGWGPWLKSELSAKGIAQNEFARSVGVSSSTVSRWVAGDQPKGNHIDSISDVLVLDYDYVATKAGYRPKSLQEIDPTSPEGRLLPLIRRVDWDSRPGRLEEMEAMFREMIRFDQGRTFKD